MSESIFIEGMDKEDPVKLSILNRMASLMIKDISQKGSVEKLEITKEKSKIRMCLIFNDEHNESEGEDKNVFFAFGKAHQQMLRKIGL